MTNSGKTKNTGAAKKPASSSAASSSMRDGVSARIDGIDNTAEDSRSAELQRLRGTKARRIPPRGPRRIAATAPGQPPKKETPRRPRALVTRPRTTLGRRLHSFASARRAATTSTWSRPQSPNGDQNRLAGDEPTAAYKAPRLPTPVSAPEPIVTASRSSVEPATSERPVLSTSRRRTPPAGAAQGPPSAAARRAVVGHEVQLRGVAGESVVVLFVAVRCSTGARRPWGSSTRSSRPSTSSPRARSGPRPRAQHRDLVRAGCILGTRPCWGP